MFENVSPPNIATNVVKRILNWKGAHLNWDLGRATAVKAVQPKQVNW